MVTRNDLQQQAKHPVTVLAGPYGHPFRPIPVTVPIGARTASLVFDIASRVWPPTWPPSSPPAASLLA